MGQWQAAGGTFDAGENLYPPQPEVSGGSETRVVSHAGCTDFVNAMAGREHLQVFGYEFNLGGIESCCNAIEP